MKLLLPPLLVLPLLLGACTSAKSTSASLPTPPAVRTADRITAWGDRPSYDPEGHYFHLVGVANRRLYDLDGAVTLDLLVNRDGTVQKVAIVASSGDLTTDRMATSMYWHARYSLSLGPDSPAPYVVRQTVDFTSGAIAMASSAGFSDLGLSYHYYPTYTEGYSAGTSNTVNGFVR